MFSTFRRRTFWVAAAISVAVTAVSITMTEFFVHHEIENLKAEKNLETRQFGNTLHSHVDKELNALLFLSSGLRSYIKAYHATLDEAKLYEILADLYSDSRHVRNFGVAIGYRLTYVYPLKGNEKALGPVHTTC